MIARITTPGPQESWHSDVVAAWSENGYLKLRLETHPHLVCYWLDNQYTRVLLCASGYEVKEALREERHGRLYEMNKDKTIRI